MASKTQAQSFYLFDIDDNLLFLPTSIYLWNAERQSERDVSTGEFATVQPLLGRVGEWQEWAIGERTFRNFRDIPEAPPEHQPFIKDLRAALHGKVSWQGPSWPLLVHAAANQRAIAMISARGHAPATIETGLQILVEAGQLAAVPPILGIYTVSNPDVLQALGVIDSAMTIPSIKKRAIKDAVDRALKQYDASLPHRFGMSDDDPQIVLAISAMRDCKVRYPDKRFFVINTHHDEFVKLEVFRMDDPVTAVKEGRSVLADAPS
jgi:hypothetical protein